MRTVLLASLWLPVWAAQPWDGLHQGGVLIVMRHADTEPGVGDPPGFRVDDCTTQRNLSAPGRAQAERFGALLAARGVRPVAVFSSAWCRCLETARLAFPTVPVKHLPGLDSVFGKDSGEAAHALRGALRDVAPSGVTVWVTHQVNASALTGEYLGMGEALVLRPDADGRFALLGRLRADER